MATVVNVQGRQITLQDNMFACASASGGPSAAYCVTGTGHTYFEGGISTPGAEVLVGTMSHGTADSLLGGFSCQASVGEGIYVGAMADFSGDSAGYLAYGGSTPVSGGCSYGWQITGPSSGGYYANPFM